MICARAQGHTVTHKHLSDRTVLISCLAEVDLLPRVFDQSHPLGERELERVALVGYE